MSELWQGVLWGALLSVPIGIVTNLASVPIGKWIGKRNQRAADRQLEADADFAAQARDYLKDRAALYTYLLNALIRMAYIGAVFGLLSGFLFLGGQALSATAASVGIAMSNPGFLEIALFALPIAGQLVALIGTLIVMNIARPAVLILNEVRKLKREETRAAVEQAEA